MQAAQSDQPSQEDLMEIINNVSYLSFLRITTNISLVQI